MPNNLYTAESIKKLKGLEAVRKRPGMYIGGADIHGLHHLVAEIVDNSIDEALAGYASEITVTLHSDLSVSVFDNGRGIPVEKVKGEFKTAVELVFTELHAGGKFSSDSYKTSGGLHGVGSSVVNALSSKLEVIVSRNDKSYKTAFIQDSIVEKTHEIPLQFKRGTLVKFWPDYKFFKDARLNFSTIAERLKESSFLVSNLKITIIDEIKNHKEVYQSQKGLEEFLDFINGSKSVISKPVSYKETLKNIEVEFAFQYSDDYSSIILSFVNNVKTIDGGSHEAGIKSAFVKVINDYAFKEAFIKKQNIFDFEDIKEGLSLILSLKIPENLLEFVGQTKSKLGTTEARHIVEEIATKKLEIWFLDNKKEAKNIVNKIKNAYEIRLEERKRRQENRKSKNILKEKYILSDKLTPAMSKNPLEKELFLVEGDSAGGSAKSGRNRNFQAILPLRGKVINSEKSKMLDILENTEIATIINSIGAGFGKDFDSSKAQYNKIIIMTDADTDGAHIQILLLTFFYRFMRKLIEDGKIYIALAPLYKVTYKSKNQYYYAWDDSELKDILEKNAQSSYEIQRYKGLGEMNSDQLWETTMNPETRTLIKATISDAILAEKRVSTLMGDNVKIRKEWIDNNVNFSNDDDFLEQIN
ncbi:DNA gyrase/topoisomerase IV subunit B [Mycoplasmopsis synoviae]|uniref:DNA topoisomerase (ATP-hydrolyzing) n=1 Tax=Mycoplasmopsis synoviae (strain 53) TaxID=262723 RepID=Q4A5H2_MYCS5|nr:DNA topoisomerase IV subunit B [Mycoplasmopsis synoviae]AAZ43999.1 topoisomerase IV subunit B [Mycoplasmopsis synoviae 53]